MKTYTSEEMTALDEVIEKFGLGEEHDNYGQVVLYTGIYLWRDGTYRSEPDPNHEDGFPAGSVVPEAETSKETSAYDSDYLWNDGAFGGRNPPINSPE